MNFLRNPTRSRSVCRHKWFVVVVVFFVFFTCGPFTWSCWPMSSPQLFGRAPEREIKSDSGCNSL